MITAKRRKKRRKPRTKSATWAARIAAGACGQCGGSNAGGSRCHRCADRQSLQLQRNRGRVARRRKSGAPVRCHDCYTLTTGGVRCVVCADVHRFKQNRAGAELRAACGLSAKRCGICGEERHNRRTCPQATAART